MSKAIIRKHQCLVDIALQECGHCTALFELALLNGLSLTEIVAPGVMLQRPAVYDAQVVKDYEQRAIEPATLDDETAIPGGIGYMGIGINFKVS
jgi:hypothetical protein